MSRRTPAPVFLRAWTFTSLFTALSSVSTLLRATPADFLSFYYASEAVARHHDPYDIGYLQLLAQHDACREHVYPYLYPPVLATLLRPLASLPLALAHKIWLAGLVVAAGSIGVLTVYWDRIVAADEPAAPHEGRTFADALPLVLSALAVRLLPIDNNLLLGQINLFLVGALAAVIFAYFEGYHIAAGAILAVVALIKVTPVLLLLFFLARGSTRTVMGFAMSFAFIILPYTLTSEGITWWRHYQVFLVESASGAPIRGLFPLDTIVNFSPLGYFLRVIRGEGTAPLALARGTVLALLFPVVIASWRASNKQAEAFALLLFFPVIVMTSPLAYLHHVVYLAAPLTMWLVISARRLRPTMFAAICILVTVASTDWPLLYGEMGAPFHSPALQAINLFALLALVILGATFLLPSQAFAGSDAQHTGRPPV